MYKSLKKYVKKSNYFKELSNEEKENKLRVLERLLDQERIDVSLRDELIKNYYLTPTLSNARSIPWSYNLLDVVLKTEEWLIRPSQLMNILKNKRLNKGKNFRIDLHFEDDKFQYYLPFYNTKHNSNKAILKYLGSSM